MQINLQAKLLASVTIIVIAVAGVLISVTTAREREIFQRSFEARGVLVAQALEAGIASRAELKDVEKLQSSIYKLMWLDPEIVRIDISVSTPEGLQILTSNDTGVIGALADSENNFSFGQGVIRTRTLHQPDAPPVLSIITPIHIAGQRVGTYDVRLSLEAEEAAIGKQEQQLTLLVGASILLITLSVSLFLKRVVIAPIVEIREGLEKVRAGDLTWRITPRSEDELGDLARGFNETAEELKESYGSLEERVKGRTEELEEASRELEEARGVLEIKVKARTTALEELAAGLEERVKERTKELQEKVNELERFQKATVGRELKMIDLKKELKRLKEELKKQA